MSESYDNNALKLQKIVDSSLDIICTVNKEGKFITVSQASYKILGYHPDELAGKKYTNFIFNQDRKKSQGIINDILNGEYINNFENRFIRKDGSLIYIAWSAYWDAKDATMYCVARDATAIKESQRKLAESEKRFKSLVENGSDMIGIIDTNGNYTFVSENVKTLLDFDQSELIGKNTLSFIHPDDKQQILQELSVIRNGNYMEGTPFRFRNNKGEWRWLEAKISNCVDDPSINGIVINSRDITDKKILQEELKKENEFRHKKMTAAIMKAQENERQIISRELHDNVNQILATVKLYNEASLNQSDNLREDFIHKSIHYLKLCMEEIRNISKALSIPTFDNISFAESISDLISSINATNNFEVNQYITGLEGTDFSEEIKVAAYRIIQEHLANVLKHSEATKLTIRLSAVDKGLSIKVSDNGKGFDIRKKRKGIGIANMIGRAEALNGKLEFDTAEGRGCTLSIYFPADEKKPAIKMPERNNKTVVKSFAGKAK